MKPQEVDVGQNEAWPPATLADVQYLYALTRTKSLTVTDKKEINRLAGSVKSLIVERDDLAKENRRITGNIREHEVHADGKIQGLLMAIHALAKAAKVPE